MSDDEALAHKVARAAFATRVFIVTGLVLLVAVLGFVISLTVGTSNQTDAIRQTQITNSQVNTTNSSLLKIIHSCLTPGEPCYRLGQTQRAQTAASTRRVVVAAVSCAATLPDPTNRAVYRCVVATLKGER